MTEEKKNPQEEEVLKNVETAEETTNEQTEAAQEETPAEELTIEEQLTKDLEAAQKEVEDLKDKHLRLSAELAYLQFP